MTDTRQSGHEPRAAQRGTIEQRLERISSLVDVGVDIRSALSTELIRSLRAGDVDPETLDILLTRLERAGEGDAELAAARDAAQSGSRGEAIEHLQNFLQRTTVDEVPIAERRLRRSQRQ